MCAWKRGTQNNLPGAIRKGHIKEYVLQASYKSRSIGEDLKICEMERLPVELLRRFEGLGWAIVGQDTHFSESFKDKIMEDFIYLHAHEYPKSVLAVKILKDIPAGCIYLNQCQRVNSKVCTGDTHRFTVFCGEITAYECREGSLGDNSLRTSLKPPSVLRNLVIEVRLRDEEAECDVLDCTHLASLFSKLLCRCIVSMEEIHLVHDGDVAIVGRVIDMDPEHEEGMEEEEDDTLAEDPHMGLVDEFTAIYIHLDPNQDFSDIAVIHPHAPPLKASLSATADVVNVYTTDQEMFPVKRKLLRPCIALTHVVEAGKGKYAVGSPNSTNTTESGGNDNEVSLPGTQETLKDAAKDEESRSVFVALDACTFDRVLLYLEHEYRGEPFQFDPLLAVDLLNAAVLLGIQGLQDSCNRVLGSFQERVRKAPIRFEEIVRRNAAHFETPSKVSGAVVEAAEAAAAAPSKNKETLITMSGMVFDITRWLDEHPGGSTIIPQQALNVDCTVFFEIYHASRQSFLYLKEFYIGELAVEDRDKVPLPRNYEKMVATKRKTNANTEFTGKASDAFLEQLHKLTKDWRLDVNSMPAFENFKSF